MTCLNHIPAEVTVARLRTPDELAALRSEWCALSQTVDRPSCFAAPAYFDAWRLALAVCADWEVLTARKGNTLVGVMPVMMAQVRRGPMAAPRHDFSPEDRSLVPDVGPRLHHLRQISPVVSIPASLVCPAPLVREADRREVTRLIAALVQQRPGWDTIAMPVSGPEERDAWCTALAARSPWVMELGRHIHGIENIRPFRQMVSEASRNFRKNMRKAQTAATAAGVSIRRTMGAESVRERMPAVAEVAAQSWKGREARGSGVILPYEGAQRRFYETLLSLPDLDAEITPVLAEAVVKGRVIAVLLSLRHGNRLTAVMTFRTDDLPAASPGMLLIGNMIDWAASEGLSGYDLNLTRNWASGLTDHEITQRIVICYGSTIRGQMARASSALMRMIR